MYYKLPFPISLGIFGGLAGFIGGGCNQIFPVWVGCTAGTVTGCAVCVYIILVPEPTPEPIVIVGNPKEVALT